VEAKKIAPLKEEKEKKKTLLNMVEKGKE